MHQKLSLVVSKYYFLCCQSNFICSFILTALLSSYFFKLFSLSKNAFDSILYSASEQTSLHRFWYALERSNMLLIFPQGNSAHWLHFSTLCSFVHSTKWYVQVLWEEHPSHLISSLDTMWSRQSTRCHNSATFLSSSLLCALYLGHSIQLSPHRVIFSCICFY